MPYINAPFISHGLWPDWVGTQNFTSASVTYFSMCAAVYALGSLQLPTILVLVIQIISGVAVYGALLLLMKDAWVLKYAAEAIEVLHRKMGKV